MKQITAKELHQLVSDAQKDTQTSFWQAQTVQISRSREVYTPSTIDRCFEGYGWDSGSTRTEYYTEDITTYSLNLAELLKSNGYKSAIYPLRFDSVENRSVNINGCINLFDTHTFDEMLLGELKWCLESYYRLKQEEAEKIIKRLRKKQVELLYQDDIDSRCKDLIYAHHSECDPVRQAKEVIHKLYDQANSLKQQKKQDANCLNQRQEFYDKIQETLQNSTLQDHDHAYFKKTLDAIIKDRIALAQKAYNLKEYKFAENFYSVLIVQHIDNLDKVYCVERAMVRFVLKDYEGALADLKQYRKNVAEDDRVAEYYLCRALINAVQKRYENAAIQIYNLTVTANGIEDKVKYRKQFFNSLSKKHTAQVLAKLLHCAKTDESKKDRKVFKKEYIAYMILAAEANDARAQFTLSEMLWENDRFQAEMWLGRAAANHDPEAQHKLAEIFKEKIASEGQATDYNFSKMKSLLKEAATSNYEPSKGVLATFYEKLSESLKTDAPSISRDKKRKALINAIGDHEVPFMGEPPFKLPRVEESPLDAFLDASDPAKRVRIPDTTVQMADQVEQAFKKDKSENKRNYVAANLTIIFANAVKKEERTARLIATIPIIDDIPTGRINIQTLFSKEQNGKMVYDATKVKERHKGILDKARQSYQKIPQNVAQEDKALFDFIPSTADKNYNPNTHTHSEYALYQYLITGNNFSKLLDKFIQEHVNTFKKGCKVYGVVIDFYSNRASCTDCKKVTFSLQNQGELLKKIQKVFEQKGYTCLTQRTTGLWDEGKLYLLIRIRAGRFLKNKNDPFADKDLIPINKNLKTMNNQFFFHKIEKPPTSEDTTRNNYTLFESGTNAIRPQK